MRDVHITAGTGSYLSLVGASGSGKTTLLSILGGLERPQTGTVVVGGYDLGLCSRTELADFRRETVGFVFQHFGLLETATALENVELALSLSRVRRRARRRQAADLLARVGLAERLSHRPAELSGGERQRVGMARALANHPQLILADEPTGNLDGLNAAKVIELLEDLRASVGCTLIVATHDMRLAGRADRTLSISEGSISEGPMSGGAGRREVGPEGASPGGAGSQGRLSP
ncbi:MAG: ABC transporter ATP-binding protein [Acidimicrobiales bacterium]